MLLNGYLSVRDRELRQGGFHGEDSVSGEGRLDGLRVGAFGQQEFSVVLSVYRFGVGFLLVLGVDLKLNINKLS